jgi:hypothetical protein
MKNIIKYTILLIFLFCINNNLFLQAEENWTEINSDNMPEGEWEGNATSLVKSNFNNTKFESKLNISMTFNYKKGETTVSSVTRIDFTDFITDLENMKEIKELGYTKEILWQIFKNALESDVFTFDKYSLLFETTELAAEYFASDSRGTFLISKNEDMLLLTYFEPSFVLGIGDSGFTKMIFKKN